MDGDILTVVVFADGSCHLRTQQSQNDLQLVVQHDTFHACIVAFVEKPANGVVACVVLLQEPREFGPPVRKKQRTLTMTYDPHFALALHVSSADVRLSPEAYTEIMHQVR